MWNGQPAHGHARRNQILTILEPLIHVEREEETKGHANKAAGSFYLNNQAAKIVQAQYLSSSAEYNFSASVFLLEEARDRSFTPLVI